MTYYPIPYIGPTVVIRFDKSSKKSMGVRFGFRCCGLGPNGFCAEKPTTVRTSTTHSDPKSYPKPSKLPCIIP